VNSKAAPNLGYRAFHQPRFDFLLGIVRQNIRDPRTRILDIGLSPLTTLMSRELNVRVDSLGLEPDEELSTGRHYSFDLNDTQERLRWRVGLGPYEIIVFAEVIEHLYTAPELVLAYLRQLLAPGGLLILQTPNAVSLRKRVKMALGTNPFERIRTDRSNPGHYREYTLAEIIDVLQRTRFSLVRRYRRYYFDARFASHERGDEKPSVIGGSIRNWVYRFLPPPLREGITVVARSNTTESRIKLVELDRVEVDKLRA
jgi:SAM-dependent methyltransferase